MAPCPAVIAAKGITLLVGALFTGRIGSSDFTTGIYAASDAIDSQFRSHGAERRNETLGRLEPLWHVLGGDKEELGVKEMIDAIAETVGKPAKIEQLPMQPGDVDRTWADLTRSKAELGYEPTTSFREGLKRQWEAMG